MTVLIRINCGTQRAINGSDPVSRIVSKVTDLAKLLQEVENLPNDASVRGLLETIAGRARPSCCIMEQFFVSLNSLHPALRLPVLRVCSARCLQARVPPKHPYEGLSGIQL